MVLSEMKLNVLLQRSSFSEEERDHIREVMSNPSHPEYDTEVMYAYIMMHQLVPCVEFDAFTQKDINRRLDMVMADESL